MSKVKLGANNTYESHYNPSLLQPLPRLRCSAPARIFGADIWTAYELSWLDRRGLPQVAIAEFSVPATSENLVESKSFKYYLNSFTQTRLDSTQALRTRLVQDLSAAVGADVAVKLYALAEFHRWRQAAAVVGQSLDSLEPEGELRYEPAKPEIRFTRREGAECIWTSDLLKSNCPVTGQPDWASVWFGFTGVELQAQDLLSYVISFREHQGFHESCVEQMFCELHAVLQPEELWVYARYTRRGGLDINPFRSTRPMATPHLWGVRQ